MVDLATFLISGNDLGNIITQQVNTEFPGPLAAIAPIVGVIVAAHGLMGEGWRGAVVHGGLAMGIVLALAGVMKFA
jgi:hypothetical protein